MTAIPSRTTDSFDETFDVIVVGSGHAGSIAAIEAHDAGASVLLLEKSSVPGGISILAGGGIIHTRTPEQTLAYLQALNGGRTPDDVLAAFVHGLTDIESYIRRLAEINGAVVAEREREGNYPYPGFRSLRFVSIDSVPGFDPVQEYPHATGTRPIPKGIGVYKVVHDNVRARNITVRFSTPAVRLITSQANEVLGVWVEGKDGPKAIAARRGVVLACGGFESSAALQTQFWQAGAIPGVVRTHTGNGVRMASDVGAGLWHMWHAHGTYGFHHSDPAFPFGIRVKRLPDWTPGGVEAAVPLSWILLNSKGQRFVNEYPPYLQDTGHRPFDSFDPVHQRFANLPAWLVFDEDGRGLYPVGHVVFNDPDVPSYTWSNDNLAEVENGILHRADTIAELAGLLNVDTSVLQATLDRWNASVDQGSDAEFHRQPATLTAVRRPPFYAAKVGPILSNTQGGPVHDPSQRILTSFGEPIPRLYAAGELGGLWGFLYQAGGNLAECFVGGRIAGRSVANLEPWS